MAPQLSMSSLNISSICRTLGSAGQRYLRKRSRCATSTIFVLFGLTATMETVLPPPPCDSTVASGKMSCQGEQRAEKRDESGGAARQTQRRHVLRREVQCGVAIPGKNHFVKKNKSTFCAAAHGP